MISASPTRIPSTAAPGNPRKPERRPDGRAHDEADDGLALHVAAERAIDRVLNVIHVIAPRPRQEALETVANLLALGQQVERQNGQQGEARERAEVPDDATRPAESRLGRRVEVRLCALAQVRDDRVHVLAEIVRGTELLGLGEQRRIRAGQALQDLRHLAEQERHADAQRPACEDHECQHDDRRCHASRDAVPADRDALNEPHERVEHHGKQDRQRYEDHDRAQRPQADQHHGQGQRKQGRS